jgi:hypothetical protein
MTVRNLCAHCVNALNQKAIAQVTAAAGSDIALKEGDPIKLDKKRFTNYTATLPKGAGATRAATMSERLLTGSNKSVSNGCHGGAKPTLNASTATFEKDQLNRAGPFALEGSRS